MRFRTRVMLAMATVLVATILVPAPPASAAAPTIDSFDVTLDAQPNTVGFTWSTSDAVEAYIYGPAFHPAGNGLLRDVGFLPTLDGTTTRQTVWGMQHYTLAAKSASGEWVHVQRDVYVPPPTMVTITSENPKVISYFDDPLPDHAITWELNGADYVRVTLPNRTVVSVAAPVTSYTVTEAELATMLPPSGQGELEYKLQACVEFPQRDPNEHFCSEPASAYVSVSPSRLRGTFRQYRNHPVWLGHTVSWDAMGANWFYLDAPTLGLNDHLTAASSYEFPASVLNAHPGIHTITLKSCKWDGGAGMKCAFQEEIRSSVAGTATYVAPVSTELYPTSVFDLNVAGVVDGTKMVAQRRGTVVSNCGCQGQAVAAGQLLATVSTVDVSTTQLVVGQGTWTEKPWTDDFNPLTGERPSRVFERGQFLGAGNNGPVALDANGDMFVVGEQTTRFTHIEDNTIKDYEIPLLRKCLPSPTTCTYLSPVTPFAFLHVQTNISSTQDLTEAGGDVWFTQGWPQAKPELHNHSRVFRFDPEAMDSPSTVQDDRFCAYNVPGDHNLATGVAFDGTRTWFVENRGNNATSYLVSFNPADPAFSNCHGQNTLDYSVDPPSFTSGYCDPDPAVQANCFERVLLPPSMNGSAQLAIDPDGSAIWIATYLSGVSHLGRYDLATGELTAYPLPTPVVGASLFGGSTPWKVDVSGNYVYVAEFGDGDVVRFDKTMMPSTQCESLVDGQNPCMSEVHVPGNSVFQTRIHNDRLYFTTSGIRPHESSLGYIDLNNWGSGVIYTGMSDGLVAPDRRAVSYGSYGWMDIDPATGRIAFTDFARRQVIRLEPR